MKFEGFVIKINIKEGRGKRGAWKAYSAKLEKANGQEYDEWVSLGFDAPPFKEGDYVQLETEDQDGRQQYVKGTGRVKKNAPARAGTQNSSNKGAAAGSSSAPASASGPTNDERQKSITYQSSRKDAIELVNILLAHGALPISEAKTKAGSAKRFAEVTAAVDKFTVEFYNDVLTLRVLTEVADAGEVKAEQKQNDLPDDKQDPNDGPDPDQDQSNGASTDDDDGWDS